VNKKTSGRYLVRTFTALGTVKKSFIPLRNSPQFHNIPKPKPKNKNNTAVPNPTAEPEREQVFFFSFQ
jgi:hypothetical protein